LTLVNACLCRQDLRRSRLREAVLGGATRNVLRSMTVSVFMSH
jgi:nucleotide-binding universal stress UspA family protein